MNDRPKQVKDRSKHVKDRSKHVNGRSKPVMDKLMHEKFGTKHKRDRAMNTI